MMLKLPKMVKLPKLQRMLKLPNLVYLIAIVLYAFSLPTFAETADGGAEAAESKALYEIGAHLGNLLPNQINGVTEIMGLGGVRIGARISPGTYAEGGLIMGNGSDVQWKNLHADIRMDIPVENLVGLAYVGADTIYYRGADGNTRLIFGGHAGGGIQAALTEVLWFRTDMKFSFSPGTSLYVGLGLVFRFGG